MRMNQAKPPSSCQERSQQQITEALNRIDSERRVEVTSIRMGETLYNEVYERAKLAGMPISSMGHALFVEEYFGSGRQDIRERSLKLALALLSTKPEISRHITLERLLEVFEQHLVE